MKTHSENSANMRLVAVSSPGKYWGEDGSKQLDPKLAAILSERRECYLRYLERRLGNRYEAEEVLQNFHIRMLTDISQIRDNDSIVAWLHKVLKSALADHFRRKPGRQRTHQRL